MKILKSIQQSFAKRIIIRVLAYVILLIIVALSVLYYSSRSIIEENIEEQLRLMEHEVALKIESHHLRVEHAILNQAANYSKKKIATTEDIFCYLETILALNPQISGTALAFVPHYLNDTTKHYCPYVYTNGDSTIQLMLGGEDYNYFVMDWFLNPQIMDNAMWSTPYYDEGGGDFLMSTYSQPIYETRNNKHHYIGVLTADIRLDSMALLVNNMNIPGSGYAFLINNQGGYITHPDTTNVLNETIFTVDRTLELGLRDDARRMIAGESGVASYTLDGIDYKLYYLPVQGINWSLGIVMPSHEIYAQLDSLLFTLILIIVIGLCLTGIAIYLIIAKGAKPLEEFTSAALEISKGNFNATLPTIHTKDEMKNLRNAFSKMQHELIEYLNKLAHTTKVKERIESELRIAREIQMGMIPKIFPPFPNVKEIDLYATLEPAKEVGGDLYDFFMIDENHLCFAIGDVSGKGVPASLFMAITRTLLRSTAPNQLESKTILENLNKALSFENNSSMFVTFFLGIINVKSGELTYSNAGHNPPILISNNGKVTPFAVTKNIPLGIYEDYHFEETTLQLNHGESIFLFTDGVTEAENSNKELYSDARLLSCLTSIPTHTPAAQVNTVMKDVTVHVNQHQQSDDITMLSIIYH